MDVNGFPPSQADSFQSSPGGDYLFIIEGEQPYHLSVDDFYSYRNGGDPNYSPSSVSSASPFLTAGDDFSQPLDSSAGDALTQCFQDNIFRNDADLPDQDLSDASSIAISISDHCFDSSSYPQSFSSQTLSSPHTINTRSYILDDTTPPSPVYQITNESSNATGTGAHRSVHPLSAPPHHQMDRKYPRTTSDPLLWQDKPSSQLDALPEVFCPDTSNLPTTQPQALFLLDPARRVPKDNFLSLPKPTHVRARSEGQATSSGGRHTEADPNGFGQGMGPSRLFSKRSAPELHAAFSEGSPTFGNTLSFAPSSPVWNSPVSIQSYLSTPSVASADQLDSRIIGQGVYEDEIESPSRATEWIDEGPSTEDSSPRVVKHNVTSRAMRLASDARMRSQARFPCRYCGQCLTTKGGLRNHVNSHLGLKPFTCSVPGCRKHFTTKWVCTRHERTVHGLFV